MADPDFVFEVSWEVCNKVGGIYTVVRSKAGRMVERYGSNFIAVGPFFVKKAIGEFEEKPVPDSFREAFESLRSQGIVCHYGTWLVEGQPTVILVDFSGFTPFTNKIKAELWDLFRIDSLNTQYFDFDEPVVWAYSVGKLIETLSMKKRTIAHFHEWLSGAGILYLKSRKVNAALVFTTHATVLGRAMASSNVDLYSIFGKIKPDEEAYRFKIHPKHQIEKQSALNATIFSTVSEITGLEAENLIGRKPDIILPNGLNLDKFPTFDEASIKHKHFKARIKEFITYYFFPYYTFNLDETLIFFLSGRYEFHDKGVDIFIKSLAKLNAIMKKEGSQKTVVAFFWIPGNIRSIRPELLESRTFYEDIKESVDDSADDIKEKLVNLSIAQQKMTEDSLLGQDLLLELKKKVMRLVRKGAPGQSTHELYDEQTDQIMVMFRQLGLNNMKEDRVKVVFYPIYLTGADRLLDLTYYEAMNGSHLGVFPSYYEPWGYTPMEAAALGVSSVTTDLAGFGKYVSRFSKPKQGVFVVKRLGKTDDNVVESLVDVMHSFVLMPKEERIRNKIQARHIAGHADWKDFAKHYFDAHVLAAKKQWGDS